MGQAQNLMPIHKGRPSSPAVSGLVQGRMAMIRYVTACDAITPGQLQGGFFEGWPDPPDPETHLLILQKSRYVVLALHEERNIVVGFVTALGDGVSCAFISYLEVLLEYRGQGIGTELVQGVLTQIGDIYAVDLTCDVDVQPFYARLGFRPSTGMMIRNYDRQSCR